MGGGGIWATVTLGGLFNPGTDKPHTEFSAKSYNHTPLPWDSLVARAHGRLDAIRAPRGLPCLSPVLALPQCAPRHWLGAPPSNGVLYDAAGSYSTGSANHGRLAPTALHVTIRCNKTVQR